ncbi:MAG: hypothetical protein IKQ94_08050 [Bacteroidales bacterium]|nr:hypothetical protein [Bacteroidales bacterium]
MKKKILLIVILIAGCNSLFSQTNDSYRLKALKFFCQNKEELVIEAYPYDGFGRREPLFVLKLSGPEDSLFIKSDFAPDTAFLEFILNEFTKEDIRINNKEIHVSSAFKISDFCDCIYQRIYSSDCSEFIDSNLCGRECDLEVSKVVPYKGSQYVVLRIISYFASRVSGVQYIVMEFSNDGVLLRCKK